MNYLRISRYSKIISFVYHCQNNRKTKVWNTAIKLKKKSSRRGPRSPRSSHSMSLFWRDTKNYNVRAQPHCNSIAQSRFRCRCRCRRGFVNSLMKLNAGDRCTKTRNTGTPERRNAGTPERRNTGTPEHRDTETPEHPGTPEQPKTPETTNSNKNKE